MPTPFAYSPRAGEGRIIPAAVDAGIRQLFTTTTRRWLAVIRRRHLSRLAQVDDAMLELFGLCRADFSAERDRPGPTRLTGRRPTDDCQRRRLRSMIWEWISERS